MSVILKSMSQSPTQKPSFVEIYGNIRMLQMLFLGFSSGIPLALTAGTLQAWMATEKVDLKTIGLFSLVAVPYSFKFAWAPLMDRFTIGKLGRRRSWMLISQLGLIASILALATSDPIANPSLLALFALLVAFFSASQDIVVDAYRTEALKPTEYGAGSGVYILGYRLAMLVSGALALILSDHMPWQAVYTIMAGLMAIGVITTLLSPEPTNPQSIPRKTLEAFTQPLIEYFKRSKAVEVLFFILLYKLGDILAGAMTTPFLIQIGFTRTDIGSVNKVFGFIATILGTMTGGALIPRIGLRTSLISFGVLQAVSTIGFAALAHIGAERWGLIATIGFENITAGLGSAAFTAFMMSMTNKRFTASQYALLTSLMSVPRTVFSSTTGVLAQSLGWQSYFLFCTAAAIPGLLMSFRTERWERPEDGTEHL
jgi:PAT family beta-lactamase induction signal transducer AmpG